VNSATIFPTLAALVYISFNLARTLQTGRAAGRGRFRTITKAERPGRYWLYIYSNFVILAALVIVIIWLIIRGWVQPSIRTPRFTAHSSFAKDT
jgi:hypothetical protein